MKVTEDRQLQLLLGERVVIVVTYNDLGHSGYRGIVSHGDYAKLAEIYHSGGLGDHEHIWEDWEELPDEDAWEDIKADVILFVVV